MNINNFEREIVRLENLYKNNILFKKMEKHGKALLKENEKYRNKFSGKRCFILGNGPSVNEINFNSLKNEIVFTVNEMFRHKDFEQLNSNFHFIADPVYFKLRRNVKEDKEIVDLINAVGKMKKSPVFFLPLSGEKIISRYGWDKRLKIQYFASNLIFYRDYEEKFDFTKYIPAFQAVVQWCIAFAIYAGFKEICLLGCDATNIITDLSLFYNPETDLTYAYDITDETAESIRKKHLSNSLEYTLYGYHRIVLLFSELYKYCKRNNVILYNASGETILDCIPRKKLYEIL